MSKPKVIGIIGPTGSGKTALSIENAKLVDGEVIAAEARQGYKRLNINSIKIN